MMQPILLSELLSNIEGDLPRQLGLIATLNLGVVDLLANGVLSSAEATQYFYNAANCLLVSKRLRNKRADEIMSRGVQLEDLREALSEQEAQQEFQRELATLRRLSLEILSKRIAA